MGSFLLLPVERPDSGDEQYRAHARHQQRRFPDAHGMPEDDHTGGVGAQKDLADGVDGVGDGVNLGEHLQPGGHAGQGEEDAGEEHHGEDDQLHGNLKALLGAHAGADEQPQRR